MAVRQRLEHVREIPTLTLVLLMLCRGAHYMSWGGS
jgi:hypothetical protein